MKIYESQSEVEKDIKDGVLAIDGDVKFECSISISASIIVNAGNINAWDINAGDIDAGNIDARDINAWDINAWNINAWNIDACDINALDINALDIDANDINYYAVCCAYMSLKCKSIKGKRNNCKHFCLDREIEIKNDN